MADAWSALGPELSLHHITGLGLQAMRLGRVRVGMTAAFKSSRVPVIEDDVLSVVGCRVLGDVTVGRSTQPIYSLKSGLRRRGSGTLRTSTSILTPTFEIACRGGYESGVTTEARPLGEIGKCLRDAFTNWGAREHGGEGKGSLPARGCAAYGRTPGSRSTWRDDDAGRRAAIVGRCFSRRCRAARACHLTRLLQE